ncbi:MAG: glycosyltransferase [Candidatus Merdivicinus sp.]|jgi:glycosyltransferase involved in cell wall biosynthesis
MKQNLLIVTEHYPCGTQESFLENEINELKKFYKVHVITTDTERLMSQSLPKDVVFYRPAEKVSGLQRMLVKLACRFSRGYQEEAAIARAEGRWTPEFQKHLLNMLVKSRLLYNYIRSQDLFEKEEPLLIYSANFNDYLYGLCCLKDFSDDIRVVARCHNANMFNPRTGARRDTLNGVINRAIDAVYFTSEHSRQLYLDNFVQPGEDISHFQVARLGVPGQEREPLEPLPEFFLRVVTCSPIEKDKRLNLLVDALSRVEGGCIEWVHIGTGSKQKELSEYVRTKLGEKKGIRCRFLGKLNRKEIYRYYRENYVDMFLSVSAAESVPTAMMEAMANRIFVAATNVDGVSAVVDNDNGMLLPADVTAEQLGKALDGFCRISKERIAQKGERAYLSWKEKFDADRNCVDFAETLAHLSGQTEKEIEEERAEAERAAQNASERRIPEPLQMPAAHASIREMPVSFRESLKADGLLTEEDAAEPVYTNRAEEITEEEQPDGFFPEEDSPREEQFSAAPTEENLEETLEDSAKLLEELDKLAKK